MLPNKSSAILCHKKNIMNQTYISWARLSWNPTTGCTKCSALCNLCFAEKETKIRQKNPNFNKYEKGFDVVVEHPHTLSEPFKLTQPATIFVNSMSDLFHKDVSLDFIKKVFDVMNQTPQHTYMVLTKRYHLLEKYSDELNWSDNIFMGISVGDKISTRGIASLQKCGAKKKFLSVEPLIEEVTEMNLEGLDLVIVGGESGGDLARPMPKEWVITVKELCDTQNVPFYFKQWGMKRNNPDQNDPTMNNGHRYYTKSGCMLDGKIYHVNPANKNQIIPTMKFMDNEFYVMDEVQDLKSIWELKSFMPMMEEELYKALKADIKNNGINDPILYWVTPAGDKLVIEGHTRLMVAIELKLKDIPQKQVNERFDNLEDIKLWMLKNQVQRRNMSKTEKLLLAYKCKETIEKAAWLNISRGGKKVDVSKPVDTNEEIAKIAGVGRTMVVEYTRILNNASQTVLDKVHKGDMSISAANKTIKGELDEPKKEKVVKVAKEPEIMMLKSVEQGTELIKSGGISAVMLVKDNDQIKKLSRKQIKMTGFYIIEFDAA